MAAGFTLRLALIHRTRTKSCWTRALAKSATVSRGLFVCTNASNNVGMGHEPDIFQLIRTTRTDLQTRTASLTASALCVASHLTGFPKSAKASIDLIHTTNFSDFLRLHVLPKQCCVLLWSEMLEWQLLLDHKGSGEASEVQWRVQTRVPLEGTWSIAAGDLSSFLSSSSSGTSNISRTMSRMSPAGVSPAFVAQRAFAVPNTGRPTKSVKDEFGGVSHSSPASVADVPSRAWQFECRIQLVTPSFRLSSQCLGLREKLPRSFV